MVRFFFVLTCILSFSVLSFSQSYGQWCLSHKDNIIAYLTWDNTKWTAKWDGNNFVHAPNGDWNKAHTDNIIAYLTWDNTKWTAKWDGSKFIHAPNGDFNHSHPDIIINYLTWDNSKWSAKRIANEFIHAPFQEGVMESGSNCLILKSFWCNRTTEYSEDEIYFLVAGIKSDNTEIKYCIPNSGHWSVNDNGGPQKQSLEKIKGETVLWSGDLKNGESVELTILCMEVDNGDAGKVMQLASDVGKEINPNDKTVGTIADIVKVIGTIFANNTDDFPGAFSVLIQRDNNGKLSFNWKTNERCEDKGTLEGAKRFDLKGDRAEYLIGLDVRGY